jgi:hypothetical protein
MSARTKEVLYWALVAVLTVLFVLAVSGSVDGVGDMAVYG